MAHAYELALELGDRDDTRLEAALLSMWSAAGIEGCSAEHEPVPLSLSSLLQFGRLDGSLILPTGKPLVCFVTVVRLGDAETSSEEQLASLEGAASDYAPDWLELCLPMDALAEIDSRVGHYPFGFIDDPDPSEWTRPLDDWLAKIGIQIYATATFRLGLVGYDAVMEDGSGSMANGIPRERINGYLWPNASGVGYYPANAGDWWWRHGPGAQFKKFRSAGNRALWRFRSTVHIHLDQLEHRLEDWLSRYRERSQ